MGISGNLVLQCHFSKVLSLSLKAAMLWTRPPQPTGDVCFASSMRLLLRNKQGMPDRAPITLNALLHLITNVTSTLEVLATKEAASDNEVNMKFRWSGASSGVGAGDHTTSGRHLCRHLHQWLQIEGLESAYLQSDYSRRGNVPKVCSI